MIPTALKLWLLIFLGAVAPTEERYPRATTVFHSSFEAQTDRDFDGWPDGWTRRRGAGFPHYVETTLRPEPTAPDGKRVLQVKLDGGSVAIASPRVPISARSSYQAEAMVRTDGLQHDSAFVTLSFLDGAFRELETHASGRLQRTNGWTRLRVGPLAPHSRDARFAVITLNLKSGEIADLKGTVAFDDIWLGRQPHIALTTGQPHNLYLSGEPIEVQCEASDLPATASQVTFELLDPDDQLLASETRPLQLADQAIEPAAAEGAKPPLKEQPAMNWGSASWQPPVPGGGFYRVRVSMQGADGLVHESSTNLAVLVPLLEPRAGEFGWSLNRGSAPLAMDELPELLAQMGVSRLKYPLWHARDNRPRAADLSRLVDQLNARGIAVVGMLSPPAEVRAALGLSATASASQTFALDAKTWFPTVESTLLDLSLKVRRWQLGLDDDLSLARDPYGPARLAAVREQFNRMGPGLELGLPWDWLQEPPPLPGCQFLSLTADPPLTAAELSEYLAGNSTVPSQRFVNLLPLSRQQHGGQPRVLDLVQRMLAAKLGGADAIFMAEPIGTDRGLLHDDGTPSELLLPWRTMATVLSGATAMGSMPLPSGSQNQVFSRDGQVVMILWNDQPQQERLWLGPEARRISVWGEVSALPIKDGQQEIAVARMPTVIVGMSGEAARLRMEFKLAQPRLISITGESQGNTLLFTNPLPRPLAGTLRLIIPEGWRIRPAVIPVKLAAGEQLQVPLQITLPYAVDSGRHTLQMDCELTADDRYTLSLYRPIEVGLGEIAIELTSHLTEDGQLRVEQRLVNHGATPASFRCQLQAPDRRPLRTQVLNATDNEDVKHYQFPDGRELVGKTLWLRAEEIDGRRVFNHRLQVKE